MKIIFASNNKGKINQVKHYLPNFEVLSLKDAGIDIDIPENEDSFEGNAKLKAQEIHKLTGELVLADDSGLCIDIFEGWPGVYTHRFLGENATEKERNAHILEKMQNLEGADRTCRIVCVLALASKDGTKTFRGEYVSKIAKAEFGDNYFGFDGIVELADNSSKTLACLSDDEKLEINARGIALREVKKYFDQK